jgi:hypothetical protein
VASLAATVAGCCETYVPPDQSKFLPLASLQFSGRAVARVYGAPIPIIGSFSIHTWVVTKRADETTFHRWEIWRCPEENLGRVCMDSQAPAADIGAGGTFVIAERIGADAESIVAFVEERRSEYPFKATYVPVPGPNSNTFTQWVFDQTGWGMQLPTCAVGAAWDPLVGWPDTD